MELEEAMQIIKNTIYDSEGEKVDYIDIDNFILDECCCEVFIRAIETVLQALENSIPKSILRHKIQELEYDQLENTGNIVEDGIKINFIKELLEGK